MKKELYIRKRNGSAPLFFILIGAFLLLAQIGQAQRIMENLGRGVVAVRTTTTNVLVSWRLLGTDPAGIGFNVYRSAGGGAAVKLNATVLTAGTNYDDNTANLTLDNAYYVKPVIAGVEQAASGSFNLTANHATEPCVVVPLQAGSMIHFVWVGDLDGDGEYDYVVDRIATTPQKLEAYKRDGTLLWTLNYGVNSTNQDNIYPGSATIDVGHWDGVTVADLDGDGKAEVITKIANGVTFGNGVVFTDADNNKQWMAVLNGMTGALRASAQIPTDYLAIGPLAAHLGVGYLNGTTPSIIAKMKNRNPDLSFNLMVCAWKFNGVTLTQEWKWLRGSQNCPDGHQIRIVDVDGNGTDEFCDQGYVLNGNGTLRYTLGPAGVGHGDRFHIGKFDKNRPGLQGYGVQQDNSSMLYEYYYDASNGTVLWKHFGTTIADIGRGAASDIDPTQAGYETWSFSGLYNAPTNTNLTADPNRPYPNLRIWWDGDLLGENLHDGKIEKWNHLTSTFSRLLTSWNYQSSMGSDRGVPMFYGDIMGDWREEMILTDPAYSKLIIFNTPNASSTRLYTLPHNPEYRNSMTVKGYMQSHQVDYYLGDGMTTPANPNIILARANATIADGTYIIKPVHSGLCLQGGTNSTQQTCNSTLTSQKWALTKVGENYEFRNLSSNTYLYYANSNNGTYPTFTSGTTNRQFTIQHAGNNQFYIGFPGVTARTIEMQANDLTLGRKMVAWDFWGGNNQKFTFTATSGARTIADSFEENLIQQTEEVSAAPNPSSGTFKVRAEGAFSYMIHDSFKNTQEKGAGIDEALVGGDLKPGLYFLEVKNKRGTKLIKIFKQ